MVVRGSDRSVCAEGHGHGHKHTALHKRRWVQAVGAVSSDDVYVCVRERVSLWLSTSAKALVK